MARLGFLSAKLGILPSGLVKNSTSAELMFMEYWVRKVESEESEKNWYLLNRALGTLWEKSDFETKERSYKGKSPDKVWYPLSLLLAQTDIQKIIKKEFTQSGQQIGGGDYTVKKGEEVVNLAETTKEEFFEFLRKAGNLPGLPQITNLVKTDKKQE